ncbi:MAG: flagellar hook-associated protein 2 [Firmicutes bacterium]|nr:flagellar hook-associated protein 2 [Bacillota bacterium]
MGFESLRISGLASGMDIDQIVKDLMRVERMRVDRLEQDKTLLEWKREDYRAINTKLKALRDATFELRFQRTFLVKKVTSSDESIVTASASTNSSEITLNIEVKSLATAATRISAGELSLDPSNKIDPSASLWSQRDKFADGTLFAGQAEGDTFSFTINGETFEFANTVSLDTVISTVNSNENAGVTMYYDSVADKVSLTSKVTGDNKVGDEIVLGSESFLQDVLQFAGSTETGGTNAVLTINGLDTERTSNNFTINGVSITLKGTTSAGSSVRLEVQRDTDAIFESIKSWVEKYNETIEAINAELNEERYRDYKPLTDEQMEELTDRQIELWEEKAKSGLLKHDPIIQSELFKLRSAVYGTVEGISADLNHLSEIGISTGTASYGSNGSIIIDDDYLSGKLIIDEAELRAAIEEDPDKVMALFTNSSDVPEEKGIANRAYEALGDAIERITDVAGSPSDYVDFSQIGRRIRTINEQIRREEERLKIVEDRYWRQFTAMEKAISKMNQQAMWLMSQFGMGGQ